MATHVSTNAGDRIVEPAVDQCEPPVPVPRSGRRRWPWALVRTVIVMQAVDAYLQPVFAGRFLSGDFGMLGAHQHNATFGVFVLSLIQIVTAALAWRLVKGPRWLVLAAVLLAAAVLTQIILGFDRIIGIHIPLGVAIIATMSWLAIWLCTHQPSDPLFRRSSPSQADR
jgi:hypothetical protein